MEVRIAQTACLVFLFLLLYPFTVYPLILALLPSTTKTPVIDTGVAPSLALLFCAHNESATLPLKIENLRALVNVDPSLEILAFDDCSSDGTYDLLASAGSLLKVFKGEQRLGKAHGMTRLVAKTTADIIIFTDANIILRPESLAAVRTTFADLTVGGVAGRLVYTSSKGNGTEVAGGLYWRIEEKIKRLEARTGNVMGADGSVFAVRRAHYPIVDPTVQDDFFVSMSVIFDGRRLTRSEDIVAEERLVSSARDDWRRRSRIASRAFHTHRVQATQIRRMTNFDRFKYISHKPLRWLAGIWLLLLAVSALALSLFLMPSAGGAILFSALTLVAVTTLASRRGTLGSLRAVVAALLATSYGLFMTLRGRNPTVWSPPASR